MHELLLLTLSHIVEGGPAVLRSQCNPGAAAVAILDVGTEVRIKFTIAGLDSPCVKVAAADGREGYLFQEGPSLSKQVPQLPIIDHPLNAFRHSVSSTFFAEVAYAVPAAPPVTVAASEPERPARYPKKRWRLRRSLKR